MGKTNEQIDYAKILGVEPIKGEEFTQETVDELTNGKGEEEDGQQ